MTTKEHFNKKEKRNPKHQGNTYHLTESTLRPLSVKNSWYCLNCLLKYQKYLKNIPIFSRKRVYSRSETEKTQHEMITRKAWLIKNYSISPILQFNSKKRKRNT